MTKSLITGHFPINSGIGSERENNMSINHIIHDGSPLHNILLSLIRVDIRRGNTSDIVGNEWEIGLDARD